MLKGAEGDHRSLLKFRMHSVLGVALSAAICHSSEVTEACSAGLAPNEKFLDEVKAKFPNPTEDKVAVGCQVGGRSAKAAQLLDQVAERRDDHARA
jgi:rhodanese-related sulfurtransferase